MSRARLTRAAARSLAVATVLVALAAGTVAAGSVKAGDQLPAFDLVDLAGARVTAEDLHGAPAVVELWASWCLPCRQTLRRVDALARAHAGDGLRVLAVSIDQSHESAARFAREQLGPTPALRVLHDPDQSLMSRLGVAGLPAVYVVDRAGIVRFVTTGGKGDYLVELDAAVTTLLKE
jgi:thiol-disulfide isomerase/thioredoxin